MKLFYIFLVTILFATWPFFAPAQQINFNRIGATGAQAAFYSGIAQDKQGFIWTLGAQSGSAMCVLYKYDGAGFKTYLSGPGNPNSLQNSLPLCMTIDSADNIWVGHYAGGLDCFDPATGIAKHYRHNPKNAASLGNDTVNAVLQDHEGNLWVGTQSGLDLMDEHTGTFKHYFYSAGDAGSLSYKSVSVLYEDHVGNLWVGCDAFIYAPVKTRRNVGGLNLFNRRTGKFTHYLYNSLDPKTISDNRIYCIYEDSKGGFWIGTEKNGLNLMDRKTGTFTAYPYNPAQPNELSMPPVDPIYANDHVAFIQEDIQSNLWIGTSVGGLIYYDRETKKVTRYGSNFQNGRLTYNDTTGGMVQYMFEHAYASKDGLLWLTATSPSQLYNINFNKTQVPFVTLNANGNAFYQEPGGKVLWIGTNKGLIRKDAATHTEKIWSQAQPNGSGWAHDTIGNLCSGHDGTLWIATLGGGLCHFDPVANKAVYYIHDAKNPHSISMDLARNLLIDDKNNIWVGTWGNGLDMLDSKRQKFMHYVHGKDSTSLIANVVDYIYQDNDKNIWLGAFGGLDRLDKDGKTFHHYLQGQIILHIFTDKAGVLWASGSTGLYYYQKAGNRFMLFKAKDPAVNERLRDVIDILEDDSQDLWIRTATDLLEINKERSQAKIYNYVWGIVPNNIWISRCLKGANGELFFGSLGGYNDFFPGQLKDAPLPKIYLTSFQLDNSDDETNGPGAGFTAALSNRSITLNYNQNSFSMGFTALHYASPGEEKFSVKLENYDGQWRDLGVEHHTAYFDIPPGQYIFRIRAYNPDGAWAEKELTITVAPPWWKTWWAYVLLATAIIGAIWIFIEYRARKLLAENKILEERINCRTEELQQSLQELKTTQTQLIQSEKMASLGELTAGIAHEIQNPLNFVNNFSEVNREMIDELKEELNAGNVKQALEIAEDIQQNEEKINHHGKRADSIVKGMLEHSRASTGQKELTDMNKLADEYLRLSYHGLRAKDKSFNAQMATSFDEGLPLVNIIPQDIGRVLLNVVNNAFYAVQQKQKTAGTDYEPTVEVSTTAQNGKVEISVRDNGNGVPDAVKDKIMQPFFTTKPTGEGTGLGLSLSYDIVVKGHKGSINVKSKEGEGSEFTVILPVG